MAQTKKSTKKSNVTPKKSAGNKPQQKATKFDVYVTSDGSLLIR